MAFSNTSINSLRHVLGASRPHLHQFLWLLRCTHPKRSNVKYLATSTEDIYMNPTIPFFLKKKLHKNGMEVSISVYTISAIVLSFIVSVVPAECSVCLVFEHVCV
jgi:hypothetical protein